MNNLSPVKEILIINYIIYIIYIIMKYIYLEKENNAKTNEISSQAKRYIQM